MEITIRVEPRGPTMQLEIEDGAEAPERIDIDNGTTGILRGVDDDGVYVYEETLVLPKPGTHGE